MMARPLLRRDSGGASGGHALPNNEMTALPFLRRGSSGRAAVTPFRAVSSTSRRSYPSTAMDQMVGTDRRAVRRREKWTSWLNLWRRCVPAERDHAILNNDGASGGHALPNNPMAARPLLHQGFGGHAADTPYPCVERRQRFSEPEALRAGGPTLPQR